MTDANKPGENDFTRKMWKVLGGASLLVVLLLLLAKVFNVLLLVLAGSLVAVYFHGLSGLIRRKTKWNSTLCLLLSTLGSFLLLGLLFWLIGAQVQQQVSDLKEMLPKTVDHAKHYLQQSSVGKKVLHQMQGGDSSDKMGGFIRTFFQSTFGVLGDVYIVFFLGVFFTASPGLYRKGLVSLVPAEGRKRAAGLTNMLGDHLKKWLKGKLFSMFVVAVLTAIGLLILGLPAWLALGLLAGLLSFVPNFGPVMSVIPAVLLGFMDGPVTAGLVVGLYALVQALESNFITPFVQQKLVNTPPALILISQLVMGTLTGLWGVLLATPLLVIVMLLVQQLYVNRQDCKEQATA